MKRIIQELLQQIAMESIDLENTLMNTIKSYGWDSNIKTALMQSLAEYVSITLTKRYMAG